MEELSYYELKSSLPNTLLLDPETGRAAAYNGTHRTITEDASSELIAYAQALGYRDEKFDKEKHAHGEPRWRPLPAWATPDVQERLRLVYARSGLETEAQLRAMPPR